MYDGVVCVDEGKGLVGEGTAESGEERGSSYPWARGEGMRHNGERMAKT